MASNTEIQEIKARADIVAVASRYLKLKKAGRNWLGLCPFHAEKTPSFTINPLGYFKCFGCGKAGDVITLVQELEHLEFSEAIERLAKETGVTLSRDNDPQIRQTALLKEINMAAALFFHKLLTDHPVGKNALIYAKEKRRLTEETIKKYRVGYIPRSQRLLIDYLLKKGYSMDAIADAGLINDKGMDKFSERLMFPIHDSSGNIVGFSGRVMDANDNRPKYLNSPETVVYKKRLMLFNLYFAKESISKSDMTIICEGQIDSIISSQAGVMNITAPLGTGLTEEQLMAVKRLTSNVAFAFDNDPAGRKSLGRAIQMALALGMKPHIISTPQEYKDIDDIVKVDPKIWTDAVKNTREFLEVSLEELKQVMDKNMPLFEKKLHKLLEIISGANPLSQEILAKSISQKLGLYETSILGVIRGTLPKSAYKEELQASKGIITTSDYLISLILQFPILLYSFEDYEQVYGYLKHIDGHEILEEIDKYLIKAYPERKLPKMSWVEIYADFQKEYLPKYKVIVSELYQNPEFKTLIDRLATVNSSSENPFNDEIVRDYKIAFIRYKKGFLLNEMSRIQKAMEDAELRTDNERIEEFQNTLQSYLVELRKITSME